MDDKNNSLSGWAQAVAGFCAIIAVGFGGWATINSSVSENKVTAATNAEEIARMREMINDNIKNIATNTANIRNLSNGMGDVNSSLKEVAKELKEFNSKIQRIEVRQEVSSGKEGPIQKQR